MTGPLWDDLSMASIEEALGTRYMGQDFIYLDSTTSTQDRALQEARAGAPEGMMVITDEQTVGRGRFQRPWVSPRGSAIMLSLVLRPPRTVLLKLNLVASLAVIRAVRATTGLEARVKWPNDVQIGGKKLAGLLIDTEMREDGTGFAVVGIGINVSLDPTAYPDIAATATSIARELGGPAKRLPVLGALLEEMEGLYERAKIGDPLLAEWKAVSATLGHTVRVTWQGGAEGEVLVEEGVAEDVTEDGALLVRRADGELAEVVAGEVTLRS